MAGGTLIVCVGGVLIEGKACCVLTGAWREGRLLWGGWRKQRGKKYDFSVLCLHRGYIPIHPHCL